jgi:hypothetical protein
VFRNRDHKIAAAERFARRQAKTDQRQDALERATTEEDS